MRVENTTITYFKCFLVHNNFTLASNIVWSYSLLISWILDVLIIVASQKKTLSQMGILKYNLNYIKFEFSLCSLSFMDLAKESFDISVSAYITVEK